MGIDDELLQRAIERDPKAIRTIDRGVRKVIRALDLRERKFVDGVLAHGNIPRAAEDAGFSRGYGYNLMQKPHIKAAVYGRAAQASVRAGVNLSKERLLSELAWAIRQSRHASRRLKVVTKRYKCPGCNRDNDVAFEIRSDPREVAQLAIAVTRSVEVAAKITGQIQRGSDRAPQFVATSYAEVVDMLQEHPKAFTPVQRADLRDAAKADRERIDELLALLAEQTH